MNIHRLLIGEEPVGAKGLRMLPKKKNSCLLINHQKIFGAFVCREDLLRLDGIEDLQDISEMAESRKLYKAGKGVPVERLFKKLGL